MGRLKDYLYESQSDDVNDGVNESAEREYPVKQRVDGYPVRHYYDGENPVWKIFDDDGNFLQVVHSHEELHSFTEDASIK